jgi:hypothetical protein
MLPKVNEIRGSIPQGNEITESTYASDRISHVRDGGEDSMMVNKIVEGVSNVVIHQVVGQGVEVGVFFFFLLIRGRKW